MPKRGTYQFEVGPDGKLIDNNANLELMRKLFLDKAIINGETGPGRADSDFTNGGWHVMCHLAAGSGVYKSGDRFLLVTITHGGDEDVYYATVNYSDDSGNLKTVMLDSAEGRNLLEPATLLGYVEGTSEGQISNRNANDPDNAFNGWPRQDYNRPAGTSGSGGTVWEHWCTERDIRSSDPIGNSVVKAYFSLVATLGGEFVATVARGRRSYGHPIHVCAMVKSGFITREDALWDTSPYQIPNEEERLFQEARPGDSLNAVSKLTWTGGRDRRYYMFARRIGSWSPKADTEQDLNQFGV